ncbi:MAG: GNAT family N-acetyltransferase [Meiothermus sp.]|nr:GNAT family N-acetyltransferase [Meiothermus sp.]
MPELSFEVVTGEALSTGVRAEILNLCSSAYNEDFSAHLELLTKPVHVFARLGGRMVSHAAWVERHLQPDGLGLLRTAYVEAVATLPEAQGKGYASAILSEIPGLVSDFDLAALSPSDPAFYRRLGWELWQGPLLIRRDAGLVPTPDEVVMIRRLPGTPAALNTRVRLSAEWRPGEVW